MDNKRTLHLPQQTTLHSNPIEKALSDKNLVKIYRQAIAYAQLASKLRLDTEPDAGHGVTTGAIIFATASKKAPFSGWLYTPLGRLHIESKWNDISSHFTVEDITDQVIAYEWFDPETRVLYGPHPNVEDIDDDDGSPSCAYSAIKTVNTHELPWSRSDCIIYNEVKL